MPGVTPTIGLLTKPANQVEIAVQRQDRRDWVFVFEKVAVPYVHSRIPVRVEDAAVCGVEPTAFPYATYLGLRPAILLGSKAPIGIEPMLGGLCYHRRSSTEL